MKVPFVNLGLQYKNYKTKIIKAFDRISSEGNYILGKDLLKFEKDFAKFCGTRYAIGLGNGSDAISFSLLSLNIGKGDEVIIPANSFVATAWTVANTGAKIVYADVNNDLNIDPISVKKLITKKTKAIIPVHLTGKICDIEELINIAKHNRIHLIEDSAQSVGAEYKNKKSGSFGITGCFSLHPLKNLHVHGDGGILTTNDKKIYEYINKIRNHGLKNRDECEFWGYNSRLDNIQAAIARIKLKSINKINNRFRKIARMYNNELKAYIEVPIDDENRKSIFHRYIIKYSKRDKLKNFLQKKGIETKINYPIPLHKQEASRTINFKKKSLKNTEQLSEKILSLPIYYEMTDKQVEYVIWQIKNYFKKH